jgi:hypothetical protein
MVDDVVPERWDLDQLLAGLDVSRSQDHLSRLLERVERSEEVVISARVLPSRNDR